jgi:hypothetical protein
MAVLAAGSVGVLLYAAVRRDAKVTGAARTENAGHRGEAVYPALPAIPTKRSSRPQPVRTRPAAAAPNAAELADLSLRKIAADTSVLELSYRPFAEACVASTTDSVVAGRGATSDGDWLAALKTATLRSGVTLRLAGVTVDCMGARMGLVARADALKAELGATENSARTSGVPPDEWRTLVARHQLLVWDRY